MDARITLTRTGQAMLSALLLAVGGTTAHAQEPQTPPGSPVLRVGIKEGDIVGGDHRALQAAVDYIAGLGGGTVEIGPGRYAMRNALRLRDHVHVVGVPGKTVLAACDAFTSPLAKDGDCNERTITVADPSGFQLGDGVAISDKNWGGGFCVTTATLTQQLDANTFAVSMPLYLDYYVSKGGTARLSFPVVGGWQIKDAFVEGLTIEGNGEKGVWLDGCRGGGIYLFECEDVVIRNCTVRRYNGDGITFQVSGNVTVEDCLTENNLGHGLHPGSGSQNPVLRRNRSFDNKTDGLWVCWRVQHGVFEDNELRGNERDGISIGHKDSDNLFKNNTIAGNKRAGILFRKEDEPMGAHRNVFDGNKILDNGGSGNDRAAVLIQGAHTDLVFRNNTIGNEKAGGRTRVGIHIGKDAAGLTTQDNQFPNVVKDIEDER